MKKSKTKVIGLTGSIGMGKSTTTKMFAAQGIPSISADKIVHELMSPGGGADKKLRKAFPEAYDGRGLNRHKLFTVVFPHEEKIKLLESILHPLVFRMCARFSNEQKRKGAKVVVLEIPLLFETGYERFCDYTVCVSASPHVQKARVLTRKGMTPAKFKEIAKRQMPDKIKRARADFVIRTDKGLADARRQVKVFCDMIVSKEEE